MSKAQALGRPNFSGTVKPVDYVKSGDVVEALLIRVEQVENFRIFQIRLEVELLILQKFENWTKVGIRKKYNKNQVQFISKSEFIFISVRKANATAPRFACFALCSSPAWTRTLPDRVEVVVMPKSSQTVTLRWPIFYQPALYDN